MPNETNQLSCFPLIKLFYSSYNTTYTVYYDENNQSMYPIASEGISKCRYRDLLRSLSANTSDMPLEPSDPQKHFMEDVSRICRTIAFVKNKSILSFDNDHLHLRSHGVEDAGFVSIRNPKAFGLFFIPSFLWEQGSFRVVIIIRS